MSRLLILLCIVGLALRATSQTFRNLSFKDGLSDLVVTAIHKDSVGYMWFGTSSTIERFDGVHFKSYPIPTASDKGKYVHTIIGMPHNEVWFGNNSGLWRISEGRGLEQIAADVIANNVLSLLYDGTTETLYVGSEYGLFTYGKGTLDRTLFDTSVLSKANVIRGLALDDGKLWIATNDGLFSMTTANKEVQSYKPTEKGVTSAYNNLLIRDGKIYLGTSDSGIVAFDMASGSFEKFLDTESVTSLSWSQDLLCVGTNGGGIYFVSTSDRKVVKRIRHNPDAPEGLHSNSVYALLVDDLGIMWVGMFKIGVDYSLYQRDLFSSYQPMPDFNLRNLAVRSIEVSGSGTLVGTRDGLCYIDESRGIHRHFTSELRSQMILCSHYYEGKYYIGTFGGGMYVLDPTTVALSDFDPEVANPFLTGAVTSITSDANNNLWIATSNGVFCYEGHKLKAHYNSSNSKLPVGNVYSLYFDSMNRGWICADRLLMVEPSAKGQITDKFPDGFVDRKGIMNVYEDSAHNLYFLPNKGSMYVSDLSLSNCRLIAATPLEDRALEFIIEDDEHWLWLGTNDGLFRYDKGENIVAYGFLDGLSTSVYLNCKPRKGADGTLWFGSSRGVYYTHLDKLNQSKKDNRKLHVTAVVADGLEVPMGNGQAQLSADIPSKEKITLKFTDFSYTDPQYMAFEYQLEGKDNGWQVLSGSAEVTYYGLTGGDYRFRLRRPGDPESEISLVLSVSSSATPYVVALAIALAMLVAALGYYYLWRKRRLAISQETASAAADLTATNAEEPDDAYTVQKYKSSNITVEECQSLMEQLNTIMATDKPYINPELKIADLARRLDVPAYKLSYLFSQHLNLSFYDYVNNYRIAEFKALVNSGEHKSYTINTLMERCGFISRTTFFKYFKKLNGQTPNEYIKNHQ